MIPKKVYKIWIGKNPLPDKFTPYLTTWDILKDAGFEIVEIDNKHIDHCLIDTNSKCVEWCIEKRNYTVLNHYLRYWLMYKYGGHYMDLDVQVIKPFDFTEGLIIGMESESHINNCVMVSEPYHKFFFDCMERMDNMYFRQPEIELATGPRLVSNLIYQFTNFSRRFLESEFKTDYKGFKINIVPVSYFSGRKWHEKFNEKQIKPESYTHHHYLHSWK